MIQHRSRQAFPARAEADRTDDARHLLEEFAAADFDLALD